MPIKLPNLEAAGCQRLTACGELKTANKQILRLLKEFDDGEFLLAKVKNRGQTLYVHAGFGGYTGRHIHIDVASSIDYFGGNKPNIEWSKLQKTLHKFAGISIIVDVEGEYNLRKDQLPALIRSSLVESKAASVSLKMTGGTLSVEGSPIYRIRWQLRQQGNVSILLEAITRAKITESYLQNALGLVTAALHVFVLRR